MSVRLPEGHPARGIGPLVLISVAQVDPCPDESLPPLWTPEAKEILEAAPTDAQRRALSADRNALQCLFRALQRKIRVAAPSRLIRVGSYKARAGWQDLTEEEVDLCLRPIASSTSNALAKGRTPRVALERHDAVNLIRSRQVASINSMVEKHRAAVVSNVRQELVGFANQLSAHFLAEIRNREMALERRRQSPPEGGPVELWQGQVAALERSLAMGRLNFSEAITFLQGLAGGGIFSGRLQPCTALMALIADD